MSQLIGMQAPDSPVDMSRSDRAPYQQTRKSYEDLAKQKKEEFRRAYPGPQTRLLQRFCITLTLTLPIDYRYGPHKTKAKALKADPDSAAKAKRTSPRPNLQLPVPSGPSTRPTQSHAGPSGERAVRIVNHVPYPNQREGSSLGPAATLPTPTSATSNWSNLPQPYPSRSSYELPDAGPIPRPSSAYSYSAIPASAPASTSTFRSSMASLGASINSLAPPPSQVGLDRSQGPTFKTDSAWWNRLRTVRAKTPSCAALLSPITPHRRTTRHKINPSGLPRFTRLPTRHPCRRSPTSWAAG